MKTFKKVEHEGIFMSKAEAQSYAQSMGYKGYMKYTSEIVDGITIWEIHAKQS